MFRCDSCDAVVGPNISPIVVATSRPKTYVIIREVELIGEVQDVVVGSEIVKEYRLCKPCSQKG
jgi:hypothetical protein